MIENGENLRALQAQLIGYHALKISLGLLYFFPSFFKVCVTYICQVMLHWSPEGQHVDDSGEPLLDKDFFYTLR